jgi:hypothetical protein
MWEIFLEMMRKQKEKEGKRYYRALAPHKVAFDGTKWLGNGGHPKCLKGEFKNQTKNTVENRREWLLFFLLLQIILFFTKHDREN